MTKASKISRKGLIIELGLQFILSIMIFIIMIFDKHDPHVHGSEFFFFGTYVAAALAINYYLLPKFYYPKKYITFGIGVAFTLFIVIILEEFVLEKIFFPYTRGHYFTGFFYTLVEVLPMIVLFVGMKFAIDASKKQSELDKLKTMMAESELQFLKSQINPHFLFNNLNNLYSYALENSPKTPDIILRLSALLRYILYECKEEMVPLDKELDFVANYIQLQELQIEERGNVNLSIEGDSSGHMIAPMILIVFIENCFKHSTSSLSNKIHIDINIQVKEGNIKLNCKNSYTTTSNTDHLDQGIGLENVVTRLRLIYPENHYLQINAGEEEYYVELDIDLKPKA